MLNKKCYAASKLWLVFYFSSFVFLGGCAAKMVITPQVAQCEIESGFQLAGKVDYDGNKEYLPRTIKEDSSKRPVSFKYEYQVAYGRDKLPQLVPLYSPLSIIGFPIGKNTIVVKGNLKIIKGKKIVKEYTAICGLERMRSIFSEGETFTELRRKGLLAVRDNIELQMYKDKDDLLGHGWR